MARYIDAEKLIAEYDRVHIGPAGGARKLMVEAPTADVAEVKHGKWETQYDDEFGWNKHTCTNCGYVKRTGIHISLGWNYCPNCGAKNGRR